MSEYVKVAQLSELVERELKAVKIGRDDVAVVLVDGTLYAFEDNCPHASCSITPGLAEGDEVYCMCHWTVFKFATGAVVEGPAGRGLRVYSVMLQGDDILVAI